MLMPRILSKARSVLFAESAARRTRREALARAENASRKLTKQVSSAVMYLPPTTSAPNVGTSASTLVEVPTCGSGSTLGAAHNVPPPGSAPPQSPSTASPRRRNSERSAFSNNDRTSARVLSTVSNQRLSVNASSASLLDDESSVDTRGGSSLINLSEVLGGRAQIAPEAAAVRPPGLEGASV